jgi:hypothetical protein
MSISSQLKSRWRPEYDKHGVALAARAHFHAALDVAEQLTAKRAALAADTRWSPAGRAAQLMTLATAEAGRVTKGARALAVARDQVRAQRAALLPTIADKTDVASAMLRKEYRDILRGQSLAEMTAMLFADDAPSILLESALEASSLLKIPAEMRDRLLETIVHRNPAGAALAEQSAALDLLDTALRVGHEAVREAAGVAPHAFQKWIAEAAPIDANAQGAEAAEFGLEAARHTVAALPLAERMSLVDSLIATNTAELKAA